MITARIFSKSMKVLWVHPQLRVVFRITPTSRSTVMLSGQQHSKMAHMQTLGHKVCCWDDWMMEMSTQLVGPQAAHGCSLIGHNALAYFAALSDFRQLAVY